MANITQISNRHIGTITLDAVTSEDHSSELSITENPIESGAVIADHAVLKPKTVTINGIMVDHDHSSTPLEQLGVPYIRGVTDFLDKVPFPANIVTQTTQTIARVNRVINQAQFAVKQASDFYEQARSLAPFLPDFGLTGSDSSAKTSRVQKCYADLVASQKSGKTIEIQTGLHLYKNMLIESVAVNQAFDGSATFTISAKEVIIVETETSASSYKGNSKAGKKTSPLGKKKSGRAANQAASKTQRGNTQPPEAVPRSASSKLSGIANKASVNRMEKYKEKLGGSQ